MRTAGARLTRTSTTAKFNDERGCDSHLLRARHHAKVGGVARGRLPARAIGAAPRALAPRRRARIGRSRGRDRGVGFCELHRTPRSPSPGGARAHSPSAPPSARDGAHRELRRTETRRRRRFGRRRRRAAARLRPRRGRVLTRAERLPGAHPRRRDSARRHPERLLLLRPAAVARARGQGDVGARQRRPAPGVRAAAESRGRETEALVPLPRVQGPAARGGVQVQEDRPRAPPRRVRNGGAPASRGERRRRRRRLRRGVPRQRQPVRLPEDARDVPEDGGDVPGDPRTRRLGTRRRRRATPRSRRGGARGGGGGADSARDEEEILLAVLGVQGVPPARARRLLRPRLEREAPRVAPARPRRRGARARRGRGRGRRRGGGPAAGARARKPRRPREHRAAAALAQGQGRAGGGENARVPRRPARDAHAGRPRAPREGPRRVRVADPRAAAAAAAVRSGARRIAREASTAKAEKTEKPTRTRRRAPVVLLRRARGPPPGAPRPPPTGGPFPSSCLARRRSFGRRWPPLGLRRGADSKSPSAISWATCEGGTRPPCSWRAGCSARSTSWRSSSPRRGRSGASRGGPTTGRCGRGARRGARRRDPEKENERENHLKGGAGGGAQGRRPRRRPRPRRS